jgi:hypothetical protein
MDAAAGRPDLASARPRPAAELDAAERAERDRQHMEAVAASRSFENAPEPPPVATEGILIHFVEDGLTVFGRVWYRGQEIEIGPSHSRWPEAVGWITLNRVQQFERWGRQYFDFGPWPGQRSYRAEQGSHEPLAVIGGEGSFTGPSDEQLAQADRAEAMRGRGVPAASLR